MRGGCGGWWSAQNRAVGEDNGRWAVLLLTLADHSAGRQAGGADARLSRWAGGESSPVRIFSQGHGNQIRREVRHVMRNVRWTLWPHTDQSPSRPPSTSGFLAPSHRGQKATHLFSIYLKNEKEKLNDPIAF